MKAFVLDASLAASWCFPDEQTDFTNGVLVAASSSHQALAPALWEFEVHNSILMGLRRERIGRDHATRFLESIREIGVELKTPSSFSAIFELALGYQLTVYDAAYVELARQEGLPLASLDKAQIKAAKALGIELFEP